MDSIVFLIHRKSPREGYTGWIYVLHLGHEGILRNPGHLSNFDVLFAL